MGRRKNKLPNNSLPPLHTICSTDDLRPVMQCVFIENGCAIATNAHVLACVKLQKHFKGSEHVLDSMEGLLIPDYAWKDMEDNAILDTIKVDRKEERSTLSYFDGVRTVTYRVYDWHVDGKSFPNYKALFREFKSVPDASVEKIGINPKLLNDVRKILEGLSVQLYFTSECNKLFAVSEDADTIAMIMPVRCEHDRATVHANAIQSFPFLFNH